MIDGHVACSASLLAVPDHIAPYFTFSSKSTVFATWDTFRRLYRKKISAWFYAQGFPDAVFQEFWNVVLMQEWSNHECALREDPFRLQQNHINKILQSLRKSLVFHLADHQATHLMIFCPQFYFQSVLRVWQDPSNFIQVHQSPERCKIRIHGSIPGALRRKYARGINANARLPQGFVFLKEKKEFREGRSLIAYNGTITEKLQHGTASAVEQMIHTCFPSHFGSLPLPMIWEKLHQFFIQTGQHVQLALTNDDLVGFFNSVPQVRIAEAVDLLLFRFQQVSFSSRLMANISPAFRQIKSISGSTKRAGEPRWWKSTDIQDVPDVVQVSFNCGTFQACGARWMVHVLAIRFHQV